MYKWSCFDCITVVDIHATIADRNVPPVCEACGNSEHMTRILEAPLVMNASYPDGTRRFDGIRRSRAIEDAVRREKDPARKKQLKAEQRKINKVDLN